MNERKIIGFVPVYAERYDNFNGLTEPGIYHDKTEQGTGAFYIREHKRPDGTGGLGWYMDTLDFHESAGSISAGPTDNISLKVIEDAPEPIPTLPPISEKPTVSPELEIILLAAADKIRS